MPKFALTTTSQREIDYEVEADDVVQAKKRLRAHIADPDSLREGVVTLVKERPTTPERITEPKAPEAAPAQEELKPPE